MTEQRAKGTADPPVLGASFICQLPLEPMDMDFITNNWTQTNMNIIRLESVAQPMVR